MEDIKSIVRNKLNNHGLKSKIDESKYLAILENMVKDILPVELRKNIKIMQIVNNELFVVSLSDQATAIIIKNKDGIIGEIASQIPKITIKDIKILS